MAGKELLPMIVTAILATLMLVSWVILMAGVASVQAWREEVGLEKPALAVSYGWWVTWFTLPLIIASVAAAALKHPPVIVRPLALLFAVAFTKLTVVIDITYKALEGTSLPSKAEGRLGALMAGGIMLSIGTLITAVWLAVLDAHAEAPAAGKDAAAPGHAAPAAQPPAGGYVANMPHQAPRAAGAYNYGTPGAAYAPTPAQPVPT